MDLTPFTTRLQRLEKGFNDLMKVNTNAKPWIIFNVLKNLDHLSYLCTMTYLKIGMSGVPRYPKKPHEDPPKYHLCDIADIANALSQKRNPTDYKGAVYVLSCEMGKYYVGYTRYDYLPPGIEHTPKNAAKCRYEKHLESGGFGLWSYWTHFFPPSSILFAFAGDKEDEDKMTMLVAGSVGWDNVRGGKWTSVHKLPDFPEDVNVSMILEQLGLIGMNIAN
jgi:hypothetical protein